MVFPDWPGIHGFLALALAGVALYLFRREDIRLESSCLFVLIIMATGLTFFPYEGPDGKLDAIGVFQNFGNEAVITICALIMASTGLSRTGALEPLGRILAKFWRFSPSLALLVTLILVSCISPFTNNTPVMIVLIPVLVSLSLRAGESPSSVLLPVNHATLLGGSITTIGTSTNLLVVDMATRQGLPHFDIFSFAVPAAIGAGIGITYLWLIAPRLLPPRKVVVQTVPRLYSAQLHVSAKSFCAGRTVKEVSKKVGKNLKIEKILRGEDITIQAVPQAMICEGDRLFVLARAEHLKEFERVLHVTLIPGKLKNRDTEAIPSEDQQLAEVVIPPNSTLVNSTLKDARFLERYRVACLALHREGARLDLPERSLSDEPLHVGDVLLMQGGTEQMRKIKHAGDLLVLDGTLDLPRTRQAPLAVLIMVLVVASAAMEWLPISIAALFGVLLMVMTRCMHWHEAVQSLSLQVVLVMVTSLSLGNTILYTGAADFIAKLFVTLSFGAPVVVILSIMMLLTAMFTNIVDNNAAAVIGTPIAIIVAQQLGVDPVPFVVATLLAANLSMATPMAYKTNILIWNAGGYLFNDFVRAGLPLLLLLWFTYSIVVPWYYGLL
ncbi:SLC13 family permease [Permianibacter aggregans]|uniref:TrkA family protein n=1 Tax=Permianibacter aggregans TaxID=1510150 RepID=A0A4R6UMV4_9GAMM|nr:SLC13 family permease [Permianibacter aggregans]QGX40628.1 TRAP transporter large permease subunit [Permianibacter aggregans]TDQ46495.1 TrkA family protein [Permianibacter aggregans]